MSTIVSCTTGAARRDCRCAWVCSDARFRAALVAVRFLTAFFLLLNAARTMDFFRSLVRGLLVFDLLFRALLLRRVAIIITLV
jgi:hypothetical protein